MARRGRCRCGCTLVFHRGPTGYKTRCPQCQSVVRLQVPDKRSSRQHQSTHPCCTVCGVALEHTDEFLGLCAMCRGALPEPAFPPPDPAVRGPAETWSVPTTEHRGTPPEPRVEMEPVGSSPAPPMSRPPSRWLIPLTVLIMTAALAVLVWFLRR